MKKILQTVVDKGKGNCMQAAVASLFEKELEEVPNFKEFDGREDTNGHMELYKYMKKFGYYYSTRRVQKHNFELKKDFPPTDEELEFTKKCDGGVNGYFYASVPSQTFDDVNHAVIVDTELNIVHDPNPNQRALKLGPKDVIDVISCNDHWHIDLDKNIIDERIQNGQEL